MNPCYLASVAARLRELGLSLPEFYGSAMMAKWIVAYPAVAVAGSSTLAARKNFAASSGGVGLI